MIVLVAFSVTGNAPAADVAVLTRIRIVETRQFIGVHLRRAHEFTLHQPPVGRVAVNAEGNAELRQPTRRGDDDVELLRRRSLNLGEHRPVDAAVQDRSGTPLARALRLDALVRPRAEIRRHLTPYEHVRIAEPRFVTQCCLDDDVNAGTNRLARLLDRSLGVVARDVVQVEDCTAFATERLYKGFLMFQAALPQKFEERIVRAMRPRAQLVNGSEVQCREMAAAQKVRQVGSGESNPRISSLHGPSGMWRHDRSPQAAI